jgi:hypothetical protein
MYVDTGTLRFLLVPEPIIQSKDSLYFLRYRYPVPVLAYLEVRCFAVAHAECLGGRVHTDEQQVRRPEHTGFHHGRRREQKTVKSAVQIARYR